MHFGFRIIQTAAGAHSKYVSFNIIEQKYESLWLRSASMKLCSIECYWLMDYMWMPAHQMFTYVENILNNILNSWRIRYHKLLAQETRPDQIYSGFQSFWSRIWITIFDAWLKKCSLGSIRRWIQNIFHPNVRSRATDIAFPETCWYKPHSHQSVAYRCITFACRLSPKRFWADV